MRCQHKGVSDHARGWLAKVQPKPPDWAICMGLPTPHEGECFRHYVERLGLDCDEMLVELAERTGPEIANLRLATAIRKSPAVAAEHRRIRDRIRSIPPRNAI